MYISYEEGNEGVFTLEEMQVLYITKVDKKEYPDFDGWLLDMLKSGVFEEVK